MGCNKPKRRGSGYRYCSEECQKLANQRTPSSWHLSYHSEEANQARRAWLKRYHLTPEQYLEKLASQDYKCLVCQRELDPTKGWPVDHDHSCCPGKRSCGACVRGILCFYCNNTVVSVVEKGLHLAALRYLESYR